ncbi:hypothetical protein HH214_00880 [Mucilaginibacter robiniae]|uniref:Lipocalin-like domain-containing protein n=1 Tax=Mucilaginibacter robiniae TaxID=2728022 RepID=A0A7L5DTT5_9SPHI|nr:hypothetical protein [Mucilaginibacter robiniae]QJD94525.1 hypothetical protein HH214_00880 [Mucilaginibacter robiniae]
MKTLHRCLFLFFMVGAALTSCGKKSPEKLVNTWQVTKIDTKIKLPESTKNAMMADAKMIFTKDGHYNTTGGIGADEGTYTMDKDGKTLSTVSAAGKGSTVYTIDDLSDEQLKLTNQGNTVTCMAVK